MLCIPTLDAAFFLRDPAELATALNEHGMCRIAGWPDPAVRDALLDDLLRLRMDGALLPAAIGRNDNLMTRGEIRGDSTCWLDDPRCGTSACNFLETLDHIRLALNRHLYLGLGETEAHYAAYPAGTGYAKHRDRFRDSDARVLSWVTYLNRDWVPDDGGQLRLYREDGASVEITPADGSVCFLSELEHEVLPARRERFSVTAWFRRTDRL